MDQPAVPSERPSVNRFDWLPANTTQLAGAAVAAVLLVGGLVVSVEGGSGPSAAGFTADALVAKCSADGRGIAACSQSELEGLLMASGTEAAFRVLENLTTLDPTVDTHSHNIAHHLGRISMSRYSSTAEALSHCPTTMASGCFHGVLERHFNNVGTPKASADVTALCSTADGQNRYFQCLHGLGHGLTMVARHDLPQALEWCALFSGQWERESCAGGAFMENIVGDTSMEHEKDDSGGHDAEGHHHHEGMAMPAEASTWVRLKPEDPQYPCNAVDSQWWHACYWMQSSALLAQGMDMAEAFQGCDGAPESYDAVCYESMGRDISGSSLRKGPLVVILCQLGQPHLLGHCIKGAVLEMMNNAGKTEPGFSFCKTVPEQAKPDCYAGVGAMVNSLHGNDIERQAQCAQAEVAYRASCLKTARA